MTDWAVQSVFFCPKTTRKLPENRPKMSKTAQILPRNYDQILPKIRVVSEGWHTAQTLP